MANPIIVDGRNMFEPRIKNFKDWKLEMLKLAEKAVSASEKKGTILIHGGFVSFIEEFYSMMKYFSNHGYEVIGFERPGQGAALRKYGFPLIKGGSGAYSKCRDALSALAGSRRKAPVPFSMTSL